MKDDHALPKFIKPGDDPKLDKIIAELKAEPPGIGHGHDVFGRRLKPPPGAAPRKPVMATPTREVVPVSKLRRRGRWIALGLAVVGIVGPIVALALGRSRGPSVVVGPAPASVMGALPAENTAALAPVVSVPAPVPSAASESSATAAPSAEPVRKPWPNKRKPQRTADAGSAETPLSSELYQ